MKSHLAKLLSVFLLAVAGCNSGNPADEALSNELEDAYWTSYFQVKYPGFRTVYPEYENLTLCELLALLKNPDFAYAAPAFNELEKRKDPRSYQCLVLILRDPLEDHRYRECAWEIIAKVSGLRPDIDRTDLSYSKYQKEMARLGDLAQGWLDNMEYRRTN